MRFRNNGEGESNIVQNRFTAYLTRSIRRSRNEFIDKRRWLNEHEISVDYQDYMKEIAVAVEEMKLPESTDYDQLEIENEALDYALRNILNERERYVFFGRILGEKSFGKLGDELGLGYKGAAAIYYRALGKIRNKMKGEKK